MEYPKEIDMGTFMQAPSTTNDHHHKTSMSLNETATLLPYTRPARAKNHDFTEIHS